MSEKGDKLATAGGCAIIIVIMGYGSAQIWAGFIGVDHHLGSGWAWAAVGAAFILRFTLPLTVGSFYGAMDVWGWHWAGALAFTAPGLAFLLLMIPGVLASALRKGRAQY